MVTEHEWKTVSMRVFFPIGRRKEYWDLLMLLLIVYSTFCDTFLRGFGVPPRMLAQSWSSQEAASLMRSAADEARGDDGLSEEAAIRCRRLLAPLVHDGACDLRARSG